MYTDWKIKFIVIVIDINTGGRLDKIWQYWFDLYMDNKYVILCNISCIVIFSM